jgi:hypothetical protein
MKLVNIFLSFILVAGISFYTEFQRDFFDTGHTSKDDKYNKKYNFNMRLTLLMGII